MKFLWMNLLLVKGSIFYHVSRLLQRRPSEGWDPVLILKKIFSKQKKMLAKARIFCSSLSQQKTEDWIPAFAGTTTGKIQVNHKTLLSLAGLLCLFSASNAFAAEQDLTTWRIHSDAGNIPAIEMTDELDEMETAENQQDDAVEIADASQEPATPLTNVQDLTALTEEQKKKSLQI